MNFQHTLGSIEYLAIGMFLLAYIAYFGRMAWIAWNLKTTIRRVLYKFVLRSSYFALLIVSLMGPSFGGMKKEIKSIGKDMYLLLDVSLSMDANDIQPTRLTKIKYELKEIIKAFGTDRIGLIVFTNTAILQCPMTFDHSALLLFLEHVDTKSLGGGSTDFGSALRLGLQRQTAADEMNKSLKSKFLILVSDGEDFGEQTEDAVDKVKEAGMRIFTIGIGTEKGGKIMTETGFKRDDEGKIVVTKLQSEDLKSLARKTGGKYYEISDQRNDVKRLIQDVSNIEGELRDVKTIDTADNKYFYFLFTALVLVVLDVLLTINVIKI